MSTELLNELPSRGVHHHCGLFANIRRGPKYVEDFVKVFRNHCETSFDLYYRVYNPSQIRSTESPPLLVVHGGPSLPSDYLYPLAHQLPKTRSIVFYDQLGCGRSTCCEPDDEQLYSIENSVEDLDKLITSLNLTKFHLLGHSFGGILAYEYTKTKLTHSHSSTAPQCLSLILANAPCNMKISLEESSRLEEEITLELTHDSSSSDEDESSKDQPLTKSIRELLCKRHQCRTRVTPEALANAIEHRGKTSWSGPEAVSDYVALPCEHPPASCVEPLSKCLPPVLLIRGEYDFITEKCIEGWREIFDRDSKSRGVAYREELMKNCAHYCHLEDEQNFAKLVGTHLFIHDY